MEPISVVTQELLTRAKELDNELLAVLLTALEIEHINRMAAAAGHVEHEDLVF
jgi:hypothetical protein